MRPQGREAREAQQPSTGDATSFEFRNEVRGRHGDAVCAAAPAGRRRTPSTRAPRVREPHQHLSAKARGCVLPEMPRLNPAAEDTETYDSEDPDSSPHHTADGESVHLQKAAGCPPPHPSMCARQGGLDRLGTFRVSQGAVSAAEGPDCTSSAWYKEWNTVSQSCRGAFVGALYPGWPIPGRDTVPPSGEAGLSCNNTREASSWGPTVSSTCIRVTREAPLTGMRVAGSHHPDCGWSLCPSERAEGSPAQHPLMCSLAQGHGGHTAPPHSGWSGSPAAQE